MCRMHAGVFILFLQNSIFRKIRQQLGKMQDLKSTPARVVSAFISPVGFRWQDGRVRAVKCDTFSQLLVDGFFFNTARTISTQPHVDQGNYLECRSFVEIKFNELVLHFSPANICGGFFSNKNFLPVEINCVQSDGRWNSFIY